MAFNPLPLTFGTEVENVYATRRTPASDFLSTGCYDYMYSIKSMLTAKGIAANCATTHDQVDYSTWTITYDGSIVAENAPGWRYHSTELISPPLPVPAVNANPASSKGIQQVASVVNTVKGVPGGDHKAFVTGDCGLHIHIGLAPGLPLKRLPLPVLQELAMLLVRFEGTISMLHPYGRRGYPGTRSAHYCASNLISFLKTGHTECVVARGEDPLIPAAEIISRVFEKGIDVEKLAWLMGADTPLDAKAKPRRTAFTRAIGFGRGEQQLAWDPAWDGDGDSGYGSESKEEESYRGSKYKTVRWDLLTQEGRPQTIEFRQPDGCLEADAIGRTVQFYTALVRAAERLAFEHAVEGGVTAEEYWMSKLTVSGPANMDALFDTLQLTTAARRFWVGRVVEYIVEEEAHKGVVWRRCFMCMDKYLGKKVRRRERRLAATVVVNRDWDAEQNPAWEKVERGPEVGNG